MSEPRDPREERTPAGQGGDGRDASPDAVGTSVGRDSDAPPQMNPPVRRSRRELPRPGDDPLGFLWASVRMGWRWLIRMRTALYLLALLGLLSLLATVVPQEPNVASTVMDWRTGEEGPGETVAGLIDLVGGFDVYGSPAFLAVLLLLFLSLTACLIPRITGWLRLVRRSQPPRSRHLDDQPQVARLRTQASPDEVHEAARAMLGRGWRWRLRAPDPPGAPGVEQVAAERGLWSREGGSLVFHLSFYVLVLAIIYGQLASFEGQVGVTEGEELGFAETAVSYWTYRPGRWWGEEDHRGWVMDLDDFHVDWVRDPHAPGAGQPTTFASDVTIEHSDGEVTTTRIEGNRPATVEGMKVHQLDWGYAPLVVLTDPDGEVIYEDHLTATQTQDAALPHFRSAVKAPAAEPDIGLDVFFWPFAPPGEDGPELTGAQWADAPLMVVREYRGDLQLGRTQQTINELDTTAMEPMGGAMLRPGEQVELSDGTVLQFPELRRWVGFQISRRPQVPALLFGSALLMGGLVPALYAYRRRLWVAAVRDEQHGHTLVTVAGRAFQRPQTFEREHAQLVDRLAAEIGAEPADPDEGSARDDDPAPSGADPQVVTRT
jgi:cytochrome c biogenesis protein